MNAHQHLSLLLLGVCLTISSVPSPANGTDHQSDVSELAVYQANGIKIGEVTQDSALLWTRLTRAAERNLEGIKWSDTQVDEQAAAIPDGHELAEMENAVPGASGSVRLEYWSQESPSMKAETPWVPVDRHADCTHQFSLKNLKASTTYLVNVRSRAPGGEAGEVIEGQFRTQADASQSQAVTFTVVTGQDYWRRDDDERGMKIYHWMHTLDPDFFINTGDIVYYDRSLPFAKNVELARYKWHRMYSLANQREFHNRTASYFIKDDHDTLRDDCWPGRTYGDLTFSQGQAIFREQVPMGKSTYRTIRCGKDLQIWMVEGRDFRSSNKSPDGPDKTIWGDEQKKWFFQTVAESDATFRILISPTPLVGPDRKNKGDNHANKAFAHEGQELREFIAQQKNMFVCCGDRHWQYVSVDPESGVREYSCGPTTNKHAGGWSNDQRSSRHRYLNVTGGFLAVTIDPNASEVPVAIFRHYSTDGKVLNEDRQPAK